MAASSTVKFTVMIQGSNEQFFEFALPKDTDMATLKLVIETQCNIQSDQQQLYYKNKFISSDTQTLQSLDISNNDVIVIKNVSSNRIDLGFPVFSPMHDIPQMPKWLTMDSKELQQSIRNDKVLMQQLLHQNPVFAQSVLSDDLTLLNGFLNQKRMEFNRKVQMEQRRRALLNADPLNPEYQKLILGEMEQENINQNYTTAMDQMPEAFGRVVMLYIPMEIEGVCVNAFIDSGAQSTIMSREYAEKTNLMRLVDKRFSGIAKGVGTAKIIGRVHIAKIKFGNIFLSSSFTIIDQQGMDFLFGLDMLRRHQAQIDLHKNVLRIGSEEVPFLQEKDIPHLKQLQYDNEHNHEAMDEDSALQNALLQSVNEQKGNNNEADADNNNNNSNNNNNNSNNNSNDSITTLINLGYSQSQSQNALTICGGNVEMAASYLFSTFGGGLGF